MRRSYRQRVLGALIGLWFAVAVPGVVLPIQVLDGGDVAMAGMADMPGMDHHSVAQCLPGVTDHGAPDARDGPGVPARHHGHTKCDGACCAPATVTLAAGRLVAIPVVPARVVRAVQSPTRDVLPHVAPQVTLPPPVGPPVIWA